MRTRRGTCLLSAVLFASTARPAPAQIVSRDTSALSAAEVSAGTASISGVVLADETPVRPLRRATVSLIAGDLPAPMTTVTDDAGQFAFVNVAAGAYVVAASKPAFVGAFLGATIPGRGPGVPLAVRDGQHVAGLTLKMLRGSVLSGTIRQPDGRPAPSMTVIAVQVETIGGARRLRFAGGRAITDDRGEYRIYGLPPGDYLLQMQPAGILAGVPSGVVDVSQTTTAEVSWARQGTAPGTPARSSEPDQKTTINYATVYFPGTVDPTAAALVTVAPREERDATDVTLQIVPTARITGLVLDRDGRPLSSAAIALTSSSDAGLNVSALLTPRPAVKSAADGTFVVPAVAPGRDVLQARSPSVTQTPVGVTPSVQTMASAASGGAASSMSWASAEVTVNGRDVPDVTLAMQDGMTVSGRVAFDSRSDRRMTPDDLSQVRVALVPAITGSGTANAIAGATSGPAAGVRPDGTFVVTGVSPGAYRVTFEMPGLRVSPSAPAGTWSLASLAVGPEDVLDRPFEIAPRADVAGVTATFTDRPAELSGTLTDQASRPASAYPIVVFSTDRRAWTTGSHRVAEARPATDGTFRLVGLPAGAYYLCAVVDLEPGDLDDPSFLEQLVLGAIKVTLVDGERTVQNLKLAGSR